MPRHESPHFDSNQFPTNPDSEALYQEWAQDNGLPIDDWDSVLMYQVHPGKHEAAWDQDKPPIQNDDVKIMRDKETGLGYDAIMRRNPKGDGWDVVKILESRFIQVEPRAFLADNEGCDDRKELLVRARHHAELKTSTLPERASRLLVAAFVDRVAEELKRVPITRKQASSEAAFVEDFPTELLYFH